MIADIHHDLTLDANDVKNTCPKVFPVVNGCMAYRLLDRNKQIPYGLKFLQPETQWKPRTAFQSFDSIVRGLIAHRSSRPDLVQSKNWALDYDSVAHEVDAFNALICARHGWTNYISDGAGAEPPPKPQALLQHEKSVIAAAAGKAKKIWGGIRTLNDWIDSGAPPVPHVLAESRAATCAQCPQNGKGDFTAWFTKPASSSITAQIEKLKQMKLSTSKDSTINICEVCLCPLKLKVHTPVSFIKAHMSTEVLSELRMIPNCWIPKEVDA